MTTTRRADSAWVNARAATSATVTGLAQGTNYYWQVRATNTAGDTEADNGAWRTFATQAGPTPPAAFSKTSPANGARNQRSPVTLRWAASSGATGVRVVHLDSSAATCTSWHSTTAHAGAVTALGADDLLLAGARDNGAGTTDANGGTWWSFRTK